MGYEGVGGGSRKVSLSGEQQKEVEGKAKKDSKQTKSYCVPQIVGEDGACKGKGIQQERLPPSVLRLQ